jgi:hypothetical protein
MMSYMIWKKQNVWHGVLNVPFLPNNSERRDDNLDSQASSL